MILHSDPDKRRLELLYLAFSPIWIGVIAYLMFTRAFAAWGDVGHLILGVGAAAGVVVLPLLFGRSAYAARAVVFLVVMSVLQNHFGSWFFFHSLGMQYHFPVTWIARGVPIFLHPLTVAYFSTYYTVMSIGLGIFDRKWPAAPTVARWGIIALLSYSMAFAETFFMDVSLIQQYFSYADRGRALWLGSVAYGTLFVWSFPIYYALDGKTPWRPFLWKLAGANMMILVSYELYAGLMGPAVPGVR